MDLLPVKENTKVSYGGGFLQDVDVWLELR